MTSKNHTTEPVWVWGLPFAPMSLAETVETVSALIERGLPTFFITANTHYAIWNRGDCFLAMLTVVGSSSGRSLTT